MSDFYFFYFPCRIESEDQLDTAKKPGDDKESKDEEDATCKEERGIDMSEDFDSKLQVCRYIWPGWSLFYHSN